LAPHPTKELITDRNDPESTHPNQSHQPCRASRACIYQLPAPPSAEKLDLMKRIDIAELQKAGLAYTPFK
jgi:hypothetical protein